MTKNKKALSSVEILIVMAVFAIISLLAAAIYFTNFKLISNQNTNMDVNTQNKITIEDISAEIRQGKAIAPSCCAGSHTSSSTEIVIELWPLDASSEPFDPGTETPDYVVYYLDGDKLIKKTIPATNSTRISQTKTIATGLENLSFTYDNPIPSASKEVTISATTTGSSFGKTQTVTQTGNATLRN